MNYDIFTIWNATCAVRILAVILLVALLGYFTKSRLIFLVGSIGSLLGFTLEPPRSTIGFVHNLYLMADHLYVWGVIGATLASAPILCGRWIFWCRARDSNQPDNEEAKASQNPVARTHHITMEGRLLSNTVAVRVFGLIGLVTGGFLAYVGIYTPLFSAHFEFEPVIIELGVSGASSGLLLGGTAILFAGGKLAYHREIFCTGMIVAIAFGVEVCFQSLFFGIELFEHIGHVIRRLSPN